MACDAADNPLHLPYLLDAIEYGSADLDSGVGARQFGRGRHAGGPGRGQRVLGPAALIFSSQTMKTFGKPLSDPE
jgi:hypothetical protein